METVAKLLNKPYFVIGKVVHGDQRGRLMNFPTANLEPPEKKLLPPDGVYLTSVIYEGKTYYGFSNVGTNPTFGKNNRRIETNIFDFNENIYDKEITVCFYKRLRNERKFKNMDELVAAIGKYKSMDKDKSCLEEGEYDGFFYYDGFTVSATTKNGQWIINSVD